MFLLNPQYFQDAHTTEQKMKQIVDRLNTKYDVQSITSRQAAEQALESLTVSCVIASLFSNFYEVNKLLRWNPHSVSPQHSR